MLRKPGLALLTAALVVAILVAPGHSAPDPLSCEGYPEPRVFLESQVWWTAEGVEDPHEREHVHVGMCFPLNQRISGEVRFDVRVMTHNLPVGSELSRTSIYISTPAGSFLQLKLRYEAPVGPGNTMHWGTATVNVDDLPVSGYQEFRFSTYLDRPDGNTMYPSTAWPAYVDNGKPRDDKRDPGYIQGRGWYEGRGTQKPRMDEPLPAGDVALGGYQVSGIWRPTVDLYANSEAGTPELHQVVIDAFNHFEGYRMLVKEGAGEFDGQLEIDTTQLTDGLHKLVLRTDDIQTSGSTPGTVSGIMVVPFVVNNGGGSPPPPSDSGRSPERDVVPMQDDPSASAKDRATEGVLRGTTRNDVLRGTSGRDVLRGLRGADKIHGKRGDDILYGGPGPDALRGGAGNDKLYGMRGADVLRGAAGDDFLRGAGGRDTYFGGPGHDTIWARDGVAEILRCGGGRDSVVVDRKDRVFGCEIVKRPRRSDSE